MSLLPEGCLVSRLIAWSKLELYWVLGASLVLSATACFYADWFYYVACMCFVLHFVLLARGSLYGFVFAATAVVFYGIYAHRVGMAFHLGAQGLFLAVNLFGAFVWRYQYAFRKPQILQSLTTQHDVTITLLLLLGTGGVTYNLITTGDVTESLRTFIILGGSLATLLVIFGFNEKWVLWMQVSCIAMILWFIHFINTGHGFPGIIAWMVALISAMVCNCTHRKY